MDKYFTNILVFFGVLFLLMGLLFYTQVTKESFFDGTSDLPSGTIVILDGKSADFKGFDVYTNQVSDTCIGDCPNYMVNSTNTCSVNMQDDGNLVIYNSLGEAVWASGTNGKGKPPYHYAMQDDGNFVIYDSNNNAIWASNTQGTNSPYRAIIQPNCNFVLYDNKYRYFWTSGTQGKGTGSLPSSTNWNKIPGALMSVSLAPNGDIFGTNSDFTIYYKTNADSSFRTLSGNLKTITTDGNYVCGVTNTNSVLCAPYTNALSGNWKTIYKNAKAVTVSNNSIYIINDDNTLTYSNNISDLDKIKWNTLNNSRFHSISLNNNILVGIDNKNDLYYANQNIFSSNPNFTKMNTVDDMKALLNVTLNNNNVLVTDVEGNLWYASDYKSPSWRKINNKGNTFMAVMVQKNVNNPAITQKVYNNNGTVSCNAYCAGTGGQPWGGELPNNWNGAKCVDVSAGITSCDSIFTADSNTYCVCAPTNNGWV